MLLGNGDGTFQTPVRWSWVGALLDSLVTGDFNGDGQTDLAAANADSDDIAVLLGNGDGTFQDPGAVRGGGPVPRVPGDGGLRRRQPTRPGRRRYSGDSDGIAVLLGNGDGTFQDPVRAVGAGILPGLQSAAQFPGGGGLQRRRPARPGRRQLRLL